MRCKWQQLASSQCRTCRQAARCRQPLEWEHRTAPSNISKVITVTLHIDKSVQTLATMFCSMLGKLASVHQSDLFMGLIKPQAKSPRFSWLSNSLSEMHIISRTHKHTLPHPRLRSWWPTARLRWPADVFPSWIYRARTPRADSAGQRGCWSRCLETEGLQDKIAENKLSMWQLHSRHRSSMRGQMEGKDQCFPEPI